MTRLSYWQQREAEELAIKRAQQAVVDSNSYSTGGTVVKSSTTTQTASVTYTPDPELYFSCGAGNDFSINSTLYFSGAISSPGVTVSISGTGLSASSVGYWSVTTGSGVTTWSSGTSVTFTSSYPVAIVNYWGTHQSGYGTNLTIGTYWKQTGSTAVSLVAGSRLTWNEI